MNYIEIHKKWNKYWQENGTHNFDVKSKKPKYYCLQMFPYPSGANLHLGHYFNYAVCDTHSRFKRMTGYNVFQPYGFDAFGLPAENHALKTGTHPRINTLKNIDIMINQINELGYMCDWDYSLTTCFPDYYKWTQWLFIQLFEAGLAYQKQSPVNWCEKCKTVLANEQVIAGECERCNNTIIRKNMKQWFLKITDYAEQLLNGIDALDWPEKTKAMQKNWIGKSTGAKFKFEIALDSPCLDELPISRSESNKGERAIEIFTTRADTIFGATFMTIAPEHPLVDSLVTPEQKRECDTYIKNAAKKSDIERMGSDQDKTGVFTGSYAINPVNGEKIPVYIGDYVLATYGTGAVMAVPAHDERDLAFATKYKLPIKEITLLTDKQVEDIIKKHGKKTTTYRLRDWGIGRQRYWGCPIPIVYCPTHGTVADKRLPVELPEITDFSPKGTAPLAAVESFINTTCPICGTPAKRECDTMDTFVCSSWYFLRFPTPHDDQNPFTKSPLLPVDTYIGGAEHACMHLLYARFINMFLYDKKLVANQEPFKRLIHQGTILGADGNKMGKSKGNAVAPDKYTNVYGNDILRLYMLFGFNYVDGGPWNDGAVKSVVRFTDRIHNVIQTVTKLPIIKGETIRDTDKELLFVEHSTIQAVRNDLDNFSFNTAVARCMEFLNAITTYLNAGNITNCVIKKAVETLVLLTAPMFPHIAEEFWSLLGNNASIFDVDYPVFNEKYLVLDTVEIVVQINSKIVGRIHIPTDADQPTVEKLCTDILAKTINGKKPVKTVYVKNKLINFIIN